MKLLGVERLGVSVESGRKRLFSLGFIAFVLVIGALTEALMSRGAKDAMSRPIISELDRTGVGIASATCDIAGLPPLEGRMTALAA